MEVNNAAQTIIEQAEKKENERIRRAKKKLKYIYEHLKYDDNNLPKLSRNSIEEIAQLFLFLYSPRVLDLPIAITLNSIINLLKQNKKLSFSYSDGLGGNEGKINLGVTHLHEKSIQIASHIKENSVAFNFVVAHELGHLFLHTLKPIRDDKRNKIISVLDDENKFIYVKKELETVRDWLEWQANNFAASLLMPKNTIKMALENIQKEMGISKNIGLIYLEEKNYSHKDFEAIITKLTNIFNVSRTVCKIRMYNLNLIHDKIKNEIEGYKIDYLIKAFYTK
ncbi:MAG: ImmA/IrrE family metallo-endopeptidase [Bacteroidetes bacterium]|nr:ImmA/IrrE family metallo-endopeptidase [Bacteroidota bacterium]